MRHLFAITGTPQAPGRLVGPRPDLRRGLALLFEATGSDVYVPSASTDDRVPSDTPAGGGSGFFDPPSVPDGDIASPASTRVRAPAPPLQLTGMRLKIYLDGRYQGSYSFADDGSIEFAKLDGSVDSRLRFTQSGRDLTLFTATGHPIPGRVTATSFTASFRSPDSRMHILSGAP
jgi:hypothetical protein